MDRQEACIRVLMRALERITQAHVAHNNEVALIVRETQAEVRAIMQPAQTEVGR